MARERLIRRRVAIAVADIPTLVSSPAVAWELLRAVEPMAIGAARKAERSSMKGRSKQQRIVELELQQARYEASLAERPYAVRSRQSSDRREARKSWEAPLRRGEVYQARLQEAADTGYGCGVARRCRPGRRSRCRVERAERNARTRQRLLRARSYIARGPISIPACLVPISC